MNMSKFNQIAGALALSAMLVSGTAMPTFAQKPEQENAQKTEQEKQAKK